MHRRLLSKSVSTLIACACFTLNAAPPPGSFTLTFEDNFDGDTLDGSIWRQGSHDGSVAGYRDSGTGAAIKRDNIVVEGGLLKLTAQQETATQSNLVMNYSSGEISTFRTFTPSSGDQGFKQTYGYFEARMRWDSVQGLWPAFWTMPDRGNYGYQNYFNRSFLKFDLSSQSLPPVTSAILRLKIADIQKTNPGLYDGKTNAVALGVQDDSWTESGIKWNNMPTPDPLWLDQSFDNRTIGATIDLDVTDFIVEQVADSDKVFTICLTDTLRQWNQIEFHSREATNAGDRPVLIINGTSYQATADAKVVGGTADNANYGTLNTLSIWEAYGSGNNATTTTSGQGMEIDILEVLGKWGNKVAGHVLHWDGYTNGISNASTGWGRPPVDDTEQFHTYGVYWEEGLIEFYVDDVKTATYEDARAPDVPAYLILSLQTGGWDNNTPSAAVNGKGMEVDWVRAWSGTKSGSAPSSTYRNGNGDVIIGSNNAVYGGSGNAGAKVTIADDGSFVAIGQNGWEKFPLNYNVTANTWLEFTVDSSEAGEILAVGLEDNDSINDTKRLFQLAGSQTWNDSWQDANDYPVATGPLTYSINVGAYYTGSMTHLAFSADNDTGGENYARFSNISIYEDSGSGTGGGSTVSIGALNNGIAALDNRTGTGYLMYSASNVVTRFGAYTGNSDHIIAVMYNSGQWYADTNFGQTAFTPVASDVLLATVNFTSDTVTSLEGQAGTEYGIDYGYYSGDLTYTPDWWNGAANDGEFTVSGTTFTKNGSGGSSSVNVGNLNDGIAGTDWRTGSGYLMYSATDTATRFNAFAGNADHIIAVYYHVGQAKWYADRNYGQIEFTPASTDVLIAAISFDNDTSVSLQGQNSSTYGIQHGYQSGDLSYQVNVWGGSNDSPVGEFGVTGTSFTPW